MYQHLALLATARVAGVGEFEQFDGRAVFDDERDVRNVPDQIRDRCVRFETHPFHAEFAFLVADDKDFHWFWRKSDSEWTGNPEVTGLG